MGVPHLPSFHLGGSALALLWLAAPGLGRQDCNQNGVPDAQDIAGGTSADCNQNGIPDECEFGDIVLYHDFDGQVTLPPGVTTSFTSLWHVTSACRPPGGGASGAYCYFGQDTSCDFHTGFPIVGDFTLHDVPVPDRSVAILSYWSHYEGEAGGMVGCGPFPLDDARVVVNGVDVVDDHCNDPAQPIEWRYRTADLSPYAGQTIDIAWHFDSCDRLFNYFFGWGVDDLRITVFEDVSENGVPDACERIGVTYCQANPNSTGGPATLAVLGSPVVAEADLFLHAQSAPPDQFGYYLMSMAQASTPLPPPSQATLCLGPPIVRFAGQVLSSGQAGELNLRLDFQNLPKQTVFQPGEVWNFQCWFRDVGNTSNVSHAVSVTLQ